MKLQLARAQVLLNQERPNPDEAMKVLQPLVNRKNAPWPVFHYSGIAFLQKKEYQTALTFFDESVKQGADEPETHHSLSLCYFNLENYELAEECEKTALDKKPDFFKGWLHLGSIYRAQARLDEALKCFQKANQLDPKSASVAFRIAEIYDDQGDINKALELFDIAIQVDPDFHDAYLAMAGVLQKVKRFAEAEEHIYTVLKDEPLHLLARVALAEHYKLIGNYENAIELYEKLVQDFPTIGGVRVNYALCLQELGRFDESEKHYMIAFEYQPDSFESLSNYLMGIHYNPERSKEEIFDAHTLWDTHFAPKENPVRPVPYDTSRDKKIRLGFISGGFRTHPVGWMITKALENLPSDQFEVYCYTTNNKYDQITKRIHQVATKWQAVIGYTDEVIAQIIRDDEIDILVELSGHSADTRLKTVALEPAPVIVKWVGGLFNTTGLKSVDYLLTDHYETPEGEEQFYTEKLVRLPDDYICYMPPEYAPEVKELPAKINGHITFGCFNNPAKVNDEILRRWAGVMSRVPESHLFLKSKQYDTEVLRERIINVMEECGIERARLRFEGASPHEDLLDKYNDVDIALDPWPYSGGLTTCESLWMGVPVITKPGPTFAGRHSATHLINAGLPELVVETWEQYADKVVDLSSDLAALSELRNSLRDKVDNSLLTDGKRFGAHLSNALRQIWHQWVDGYENKEENWQKHIVVEDLNAEEIEKKVEHQQDSVHDQLSAEHIREVARKSELLIRQLDENEQLINSQEFTDQSKELARKGISETNGFLKNGASKNESVQNTSDTYKIETTDGLTICTLANLKMLTPFVLLEQKQWYEKELDFVQGYLKPGMNVLDIGAGFGVYSLPSAKLVEDDGHVFAFEPGVLAKKHLEMSKLENGFQNLEVIGKAVSDKAEKLLFTEALMPELSKLSDEGDIRVSAITLDAWWQFEGKPELDLFKLDVNGDELKVLRGAETVLDQTNPVILFSIGEKEPDREEITEFLQEKGYALYEYIPGPALLAKHDAKAGVDPYMQNLVAVKENRRKKLEQAGWFHDEYVTPVEPAGELWKTRLAQLPWTNELMENWENHSDSEGILNYLQALDYLVAAEKIDVQNPENRQTRSQKAVLLLGAAQILINLYNQGADSTSLVFTLVRTLNALGKRGQAVEVMQKLIETTKLGKENMNVDLPFMLPILEQDDSPIKTDLNKWLMVRTIEAWILLKDKSTWFSGEQERKMLGVLEGNVEVLDSIEKRNSLILNREEINNPTLYIQSTSTKNASCSGSDSNDLKHLHFIVPGRIGGAHGLHVNRAKALGDKISKSGIETSVISASSSEFISKIIEISRKPNQAIYSGIMGYDLWIETDMNLSGNFFDLIDLKIFCGLADHPYTNFMWKRMERIPKGGIIFASTASIADEYKKIYKTDNQIIVHERNSPTVEVDEKLSNNPLSNRSVDVLVPWGLHKFFTNQKSLIEQLKQYGSRAVKLGSMMHKKLLEDYEYSVFETFLACSNSLFGNTYKFKNPKNDEDWLWLNVLSIVDWTVRRDRRLRMLESLKDIPNNNKVVITAHPKLAEMIPGLRDKMNIKWIGEVSAEKLNELYADSKIVLNCNPTFPDMIHERIRNSMAYGCCVVSDYSPGLADLFGHKKEILFTDNKGSELTEYLNITSSDLQQIASNGKHIIETQFNIDDQVKWLLDKIERNM